jgi:hypothetical protein
VFEESAKDADFEEVVLDSTIVRAHQHVAGAPKQAIRRWGRSKPHRTVLLSHETLSEESNPGINNLGAEYGLAIGQEAQLATAYQRLSESLQTEVGADQAEIKMLQGQLKVTLFNELLFLCYVVAILVWRVLRDRIVTLDTLACAACAYIFLGVVWGDLYVLVEYWRPGSFNIPSSFAIGPERDLRAALMYFSFITLTTVAYGTIHPTDPGVGMLCAAEALIGQLYLAIMIARMVGLHIAERTR